MKRFGNVLKAVVLDMYGVIIKQTGDEFVPYVQRTFPDLTPEEIYAHWLKAEVGEIPSIEIWKRIGYQGDLEKIEKEFLKSAEINDGFYDFAAAARKKYKMAIISNDAGSWSRHLREKFDINRYFDVVSVSGDLKIRKPDERIFQITLEKLGCRAEDCVFVDDRERNLKAAGELGMRPILFNSRNVPYKGVIANSFAELAELIL